jgi:hypothetical protein
MNGRVYDPYTGRFLSADVMVEDPYNGQAYSRYSYVLNNPTNLVDPTGFNSDCPGKDSGDCKPEPPKVDVPGKKDATAKAENMAYVTGQYNIRAFMSGSPTPGGNFQIHVIASRNAAAQSAGSRAKFGGASFNGLAACGQCGRFKGNPSAQDVNDASSMLLDNFPVIGTAKSARQLYTGTDAVTGEPVSRGFEGAGLLLGIAPGGKAAGKWALSKLAKRVVAPAKRTSGKTVLGHYPQYVELSEHLNARRFELPDSVWKGMTQDEIWTANRKFLDRTIERGDDIFLSNPAARPDSYFEKELNYMMDQGYTISADGARLLPPTK